MNQFESYLHKAEKRQKWMIYASVLLVIGLLIHNVSTPLVEEEELLHSEIETLNTSIATNKINNVKKEIALKSKVMIQINEEVERQKEKITALMSSLYSIKYAFFNEKEFANALDEILKTSINEGLLIEHIKNKPLKLDETSQLLKHKKRIEIIGEGDYKKIVEFINHIEHLNVLLKVNAITLVSGKVNIKFTLVIDVYGIGL